MKNENNESYSSEVWLISGFYHSLPGVLTLENGQLIFTALGPGTYWERGLKKIEEKTGAENFCSLLKKNKPAQLFSIELNKIEKVTFPWIYFSAGAHITFNKQRYRLSFIEPNNTQLPVFDKGRYNAVLKRNIEIIQDISHARKIGKKWKALLTALPLPKS